MAVEDAVVAARTAVKARSDVMSCILALAGAPGARLGVYPHLLAPLYSGHSRCLSGAKKAEYPMTVMRVCTRRRAMATETERLVREAARRHTFDKATSRCSDVT